MLLIHFRQVFELLCRHRLTSGLLRDRRAVTAVEYAMIAGIIVVALVLSAGKIGPQLSTSFNSVSSEL